MEDRKIYELNENEFLDYFFQYQGYNQRYNQRLEKSAIDSKNLEDKNEYFEFPFFNGNKNKRALKKRFDQISDIISKSFKDIYLLGNSNTNTIRFSYYIRQQFKKCKDIETFISFSHKDVEAVKKFAEWILKKTKKQCFVDSNYWHYYNDLIEAEIERVYKNQSRNDNSVYEISNNVRDIVDIYLLEALQYQIIHSKNIIIIKSKNYTLSSPWIRFENNVIEYLCNKENITIKRIKVSKILELF